MIMYFVLNDIVISHAVRTLSSTTVSIIRRTNYLHYVILITLFSLPTFVSAMESQTIFLVISIKSSRNTGRLPKRHNNSPSYYKRHLTSVIKIMTHKTICVLHFILPQNFWGSVPQTF